MFGSRAHGAVHLGGEHDVVAAALRAPCATISSDSPPRVHVGGVDEVDAGVERGVDDARCDSSWSGLPQAPNIIAPRHSGLTFTPVRPNALNSIVLLLVATAPTEATVARAHQRGRTQDSRAGWGVPTRLSTVRRANERTGVADLVARGLRTRLLAEGVGNRVLAQQEVEDGGVLELDRLDARRGLDPRRILDDVDGREVRGRGDVLEVEREHGESGHVLDHREGLVDRLLDRQVDAGDRLLARAGEHSVPRRRVVLVLALRGDRERDDRRWHRTERSFRRRVDARLVRRDREVLEPGGECDDREITTELLRGGRRGHATRPHAGNRPLSPPRRSPRAPVRRAAHHHRRGTCRLAAVERDARFRRRRSRSRRHAFRLSRMDGSVSWCASSRSFVSARNSRSSIGIGSWWAALTALLPRWRDGRWWS